MICVLFGGEGVIGTLGWTIKWLDHCRTLKSPLNPRPSDGRKVSIEFTAKWLEMDQNIARDLTDYPSNATIADSISLQTPLSIWAAGLSGRRAV